ncbi:hypothetical protein SAMN05661091_3497 [Paenibacillus uliginis N3/975]|uniref:Uncharacterized protein n=1 Tax=Paenibacillus uliginis N3/975 TaxID=1313296 RepID=A0A1X7HI38_9BACL|nr:hypothetical protein [Paenibacillus uliginis]SMF86767.1 hypothetical protein SAMN05661091_3497 [Paenibacillus uliginis N3/975]
MFSYDALPESIRNRIADKAVKLMDTYLFQTYNLIEDPYHVLQWCVTSYMGSNKEHKVKLGPYYVGIRMNCGDW